MIARTQNTATLEPQGATHAEHLAVGIRWRHNILPTEAQEILREAVTRDRGVPMGNSALRRLAVEAAVLKVKKIFPDLFKPEDDRKKLRALASAVKKEVTK
jgi:hypothetical protein